jgi:hypothetical protein
MIFYSMQVLKGMKSIYIVRGTHLNSPGSHIFLAFFFPKYMNSYSINLVLVSQASP